MSKIAAMCGHETKQTRQGWCTKCFKEMRREERIPLPWYLKDDKRTASMRKVDEVPVMEVLVLPDRRKRGSLR